MDCCTVGRLCRCSTVSLWSFVSEFLRETAESLSADYGGRLDVQPIPGDYSVGIQQLRYSTQTKQAKHSDILTDKCLHCKMMTYIELNFKQPLSCKIF